MQRSTENAELRGRLLGVKLVALVGDHRGSPPDAAPIGFPNGAGIVVDGAAWVLIDGDAAGSLGPSIAWAVRHDATSLHVIVETDTGALARRAAGFEMPISVWFAQERTLLPVIAEELPEPPLASDEHVAMIETIERGGAEGFVSHGVVTGEVRGLEVCRVVDEPTIGRLAELGDFDLTPQMTADWDEDHGDGHSGVILEVGVGANDREAFRLLHGGVPTVEALSSVVESVRSHRSTDAPQHPLNRMARERFLLWQARHDPSLVDMVEVEPTEPPFPRPSMKEAAPSPAIGVDASGGRHLLVFTSGVDLDVVPYALDAHTAARRSVPELDERITIVLRSADLLPITREVAALSTTPVDFATMV